MSSTPAPSLNILTSLSRLVTDIVATLIDPPAPYQSLGATAIIQDKLTLFRKQEEHNAHLSQADKNALAHILSPENALLWLYNEVTPRLIASLKAGAPQNPCPAKEGVRETGFWEQDGVRLPAGTNVRFTYKGVTLNGSLLPGKGIEVYGESNTGNLPASFVYRGTSVSDAANYLADRINADRARQRQRDLPNAPRTQPNPASLNGWNYWEACIGGKWIRLADQRAKIRRDATRTRKA